MKLIKKNVSKLSTGKKVRGFLLLSTAVVGVSMLTWSLSSCGNNTTSTILSSLIDVGNGDKFLANNGSLTTIAQNSLKSRNGFNAYIKRQVGKILQVWFENNVALNYRSEFTSFKNETDKNWKDKVTSAKDSYRNYYEVNLRTDVLDSSGVKNINAWKESQLNDSVINKFVNDAFGVTYLGMVKAGSSEKIASPTVSDINDSKNWQNLKFIANGSDLGSSNGYNQEVANVYASFQDMVFDSWVKHDLPVLTSSVLYKNSEPRGGLKEIFNDKAISDLKASYEFQAFPDASENNGIYDTEKYNANGLFQQFMKNVATSFDTTTGAVNFPGWWTEDSASGILVETSSMYDNLFLPYAAGVGYMLLDAVNGISSDQKIRNVGFDTLDKNNILTNFIYTSSGQDKAWWGFSNPNFFNGSNPQGPSIFASIPNNSLYAFYNKLAQANGTITDMFTSQTVGNDGLPLMFLRDGDKEGAGIHIITIDGLKYFIDKTTTGETTKSTLNINKLEEFLKFRSYQKASGFTEPNKGGNNVTFDINSNIKKYFTSSDDKKFDLIINFLKAQLDAYTKDPKSSPFFNAVNAEQQKALDDLMKSVFAVNQDTNTSTLMQLAQAWQAYGFENDLLKERQKIRSSIIANAKTFIDNIKNSKPDANGIAGKLPFQIDATGDIATLEQFYAPVKDDPENIWWLTGTSPTSITQAEMTPSVDQKFGGKDSISTLVDALVTQLNLVKATDVDYASYTQNIYTNDDAINDAINTMLVAGDTNNFVSESYKSTIINNIFNSLKVISYKDGKLTFTPDSKITGLDGDLTNAVINSYYLNNVFMNKLGDYSIINSGVLTEFNNFNNYLTGLWNNTNTTPISDVAIKYLLFLNTLDYLLSPIDSSSGSTVVDNQPINLTTYLQQNVSFGTSAYVAWVASTEETGAIKDTDLKTLFTTPKSTNVDYDFGTGSSFNYLNSTTPTQDSDRYLLNSVYQSATTSDKNNYHGFYGLVTSSSGSGLPTQVSSEIFRNNLSNAPKTNADWAGRLYAYGNIDNINSHIDAFTSPTEAQAFAHQLADFGVDTTDVSNATSSTPLTELKTKLKADVKTAVDAHTNIFDHVNGYQTNSGFNPTLASTATYSPIQDTTKTKLGYFAYLEPVNYLDMGKIGSNWSNQNDAQNRLNLSVQTFLQIVIDCAMNNSLAQQAALSRLTGSREQTYDIRLMKLLTSQWVFTKQRSGN